MENTIKTINVNSAVYGDLLFDKILPAIKKKWPRMYKTLPIVVQDDNAGCHTIRARTAFAKAAKKDGFNIIVSSQPARSPDFNILDLGFFNSIQSLQYKKRPKDIDDLICKVENAFEETLPDTLDNVFYSLMGTMMAPLRVNGDNTYKLDRFNKEKQRRAGTLPVSLTCPPELILKGQEYLDAVAKNVGSAPAVKPEALLDTVDEAFLNEQQPEGTTATILGNI